jgi:isopenicillin-N epimerase
MTFGHSMLEHWRLDPACLYLNHGTVGVTPRRVLVKQQALRDEMERQPSRFMLRELNAAQPMPWRAVSRLREASDQVADFVGARPDDLVFVPNVTTGLNAVMGSVSLGPGDELVITDLAYGAVAFAAAAVCERTGATLRTVHLEYPIRTTADVVEPIARALTGRTKLVVVDHVTAQTALVLPVADVAAACRTRGIPVLVDGAHVPGARMLDIPSLGVDWYAANLHKWAHAPRGCGILWAAPERQSILRSPIVSWGHRKGFRAEFEHTATADPTSFLAAPEGIALLREWNLDACVGYMHNLAVEAAHLLTERWRTTFEIPCDMVGTMVTVPLPQELGATDDDATRLRLALLVDDRIEVQLHAWRGRLWTRVSAQVYNDRSDMEHLAEAVARRL